MNVDCVMRYSSSTVTDFCRDSTASALLHDLKIARILERSCLDRAVYLGLLKYRFQYFKQYFRGKTFDSVDHHGELILYARHLGPDFYVACWLEGHYITALRVISMLRKSGER